MVELALIIGMMLVTVLTRYPLLAITGRVRLPTRVFAALRFVPVAVLTAICAPVMLMPNDEVALGVGNAHLWAGLVAILVAWRTRNLLVTILIGMGVFLVWRYVA